MSYATITLGDLLKASAPKLCLLSEHCANCARPRPGEIREEEGFCLHCERVMEHQAQVWECSACETIRMWGFGRPYETSIKQLGCVGCGQVTAHVFAYVNLGRCHSGLEAKQAEMRKRLAREKL